MNVKFNDKNDIEINFKIKINKSNIYHKNRNELKI